MRAVHSAAARAAASDIVDHLVALAANTSAPPEPQPALHAPPPSHDADVAVVIPDSPELVMVAPSEPAAPNRALDADPPPSSAPAPAPAVVARAANPVALADNARADPDPDDADPDSDDEVQIVNEAIVSHAPSQTIVIDSDSDSDDAHAGPPRPAAAAAPKFRTTASTPVPDLDFAPVVQAASASAAAAAAAAAAVAAAAAAEAPAPAQPPSSSHDSDDIVVCETPANQPARAPRRSWPCSYCAARVRADRAPLSRCKHVLCAACALYAVTGAPMPEASAAGKQGVDAGSRVVKRRKTGSASGSASASAQPVDDVPPPPCCAPRALPVCRVARCGAPLARSEVAAAFAPPLADDYFAPAIAPFRAWLDAPTSDFGPAMVVFPSPEESGVDLSTGSDDGLDCLLVDDLQAAYAPLWVWDDELDDHPSGAWVCLACGEPDLTRSARPRADPRSADDADSAVPDPPSYPHCPYARALAVVETIKGLADVRDGSSAKPKRRTTAVKTRSSGRKRYKSAATVRAAKRRKVTTGFAKGTGYAGREGIEWKGASSKMLEEKAKLDQQSAFWIARLRCFLLLTPDAPLTSWPGFMRQLLREEKLVPHLAAILINECIMDVEGRVPVFVSALRCVHALCESPSLRVLVTEPNDGEQGKTIAELVESLSRQAAFLSTGAGPEGLCKHTDMLIKQIRRCIRLVYRNDLLAIARGKTSTDGGAVNVDEDSIEKAEPANNASAVEIAAANSTAKEGATEPELKESEPDENVSFEADQAEYIEKMKEHQFKTVPGLAKLSVFYKDASKAQNIGVPRGKRQRRIATEVASLFSSLPLSWSSTILLRVDEDRYDFLRAIIFGPEDTPYDSGAFVFDIYLPLEYPNVPPKFHLLTTGSGRVRFNPNLYDTGKVCLSLLGTWSGPSWNSASTILQVLVSIQSLILVADPYFNEPGYEKQMGTQRGKQQSDRYNERVRQDCAFYAIQANLRSAPSGLEDGIRTHFRLKRRYLKHMLPKWFPHAAKPRSGEAATSQSAADPNTATSHTASSKATVPPMPPLHNGLPVSVDTTMSATMSATMAAFSALAPAGSPTAMPVFAMQPFQLSTFEPGRNFRNYKMTYANLESILEDLDKC